MTILTSQRDLEALCERLKAADFVTVDTEFMRDRTYYSKLCLIQVADDDGAVAIDPLSDGIDLAPFWALLNQSPVLKVFHACRQDLEIVYHATGRVPAPIFDTQVAAMVCGFGDSVGYETLVTQITGGRLDKGARFTDWSRRPLSQRQIDYALGDVTHLRKIYEKLSARLDAAERRSWVEEEMTLLTDPKTYEIDPEDTWRRVKFRSRSPRYFAQIQAIAAWREREAQSRDIPRNRVARDEALLEIAAHTPDSAEALDQVRGLSKNFGRSRSGKALLEVVQRTQEIPKEDLPEPPAPGRRASPGPVADLLKVFLKLRAKESEVAPKLLASSDDIDLLALSDDADIPAKHGWRYEIFGRDALAIKHGELVLIPNGNRIAAVARNEL